MTRTAPTTTDPGPARPVPATAAAAWRVVVVDDSPDDRADARRLLLKGSERRYQFAEAETGAAAVAAALADPPDCLVLDYNLPDLDAPDVLAALVGPDGLTVCPVVVVTGSAGAEMGRAVLRAGAQDYIGKDWLTPEGLTRAVENAAERWAMARELEERDAALRESERRFRAVFDQQFQFMAVLSPDGVLLEVNDLPIRATGVPRERVIGRPFWDAPWWEPLPETRREWPRRLAEAARAAGPVLGEDRYATADGTIRVADCAVTAVKDEAGRVEFFIVQAGDITERKGQEAALRASEERYRVLADALPHMTWVTRPDHTVEYANRMQAAYTGLSVDELNAVGWPTLVHPDDRDRLWAEVAGPLARGEPHEAEYRLRWHDGSYRWVVTRAVPVTDPAGRVEKWVGTTTDIDARKRAEENLRVRHAHAEVVSRTAARLVLRGADAADDLAAAAFRDLAGVLGVELYLNYLAGPEPDTLRLVSAAGLTADQQDHFARIRFGEYLCGAVAATRRPLVLDHIDGSDFETASGLRAMGVRAYAGFPLLAGEVLGTVAFATARRPAFTADEVGLMQTACDLLAAALHRDRLTAAVAEREGQLAGVLRASPVGVALLDPDLRFVQINDALAAMNDAPAAAHLGRPLRAVLGDARADLVEPIFRQVLATGEPALDREVSARVDGELRALLSQYVPVRDPATGKVGGVACVVADISHRKQAEEALRASEERLRLALEAADTGLWEWDPGTDAVSWSPECYRIHGLTEAGFDHTGAGFFRLVHPDDRERVEASVRAAIDGRALYECEFRVVRPGGEVVWVANRGRAAYDGAGRPVRVLGTITDITDRVRAEQDLAAELQAARRLHEVSVQLAGGEGVGAVVDRLLDAAVEVMGSQFASLQMLDPGRGELKLLGHRGFPAGAAAFWEWVRPASESTCGMAMRTGRRVVVADVTACEGMAGTADLATYLGAGIRAVQTTPLLTRAGELVGMVSTHWREPRQPSERDLRGLDILARMAADLIDRKRAEAELARSEAFARSVVESSADCVKGLSPDGRLLWMNENGKRLMEVCDFDKLKGCDWAAFWEAGGVRPEAEAALAAARAGGVGRFRGFCPTAAGSPRWWDVAVTPIAAPDGTVEQLLSVSRDITDARAAEQAIQESESFYRQTLESIPGMVFTNTPDGACDYVSEPWVRFTGVPAAAQLGAGWVNVLHPDDRDRAFAAWRAAVEGRGEYDLEYRVRRHDGGYGWFKVRGRALRDGDGRIAHWFGTAVNIDDLKQAEAALQDADRKKDEFLATLAHELRNPLAPIQNGVQIIKMSGPNGAVGKTLDTMGRQLGHLVHLIDDLLDVSRITQGKLHLRRERVTLQAVVEAAVEAVMPLVAKNRHELTVMPVPAAWLDGDPTRLTQVVSNLLTNAAKYTHRGGRITLAARADGGEVVVSVKDTGIGIPPAMLGRVFEMFSQVDRTLEKTTGGLGIGLSLVRGLVEMHGGTISAHSEGEGKGSEFTVRLPATAGTGEGQAMNGTTLTATGRRLTVLVVDDNEDAAESMATMLEMYGHEVRTAFDGEAGVAAAGEFRPQVAFLDIGMPQVNGYDAARRIRAEEWGKDMLLVALTGWGSDDDKRKCEEAGFDHHLTKPVNPQALTKLLAERGAATV